MKNLILLISMLFSILSLNAQKINLDNYHEFTLDNGLKVIVIEDNSKPEIIGNIIVNVGSKDDPEDATGMAHYFEHIMFKGTDKIGTIDWSKEKVYLDSISALYDKLHAEKKEEERVKIQKEINRLSIKATEYAIPNEVSSIIAKMGGTGLNAGTSYDATVYLNTFPSNQLENWLDVYAERLRNPVFRLFQSELETVYEEKNMYDDNPASGFMKDVLKTAFGEHPYGRPIIGYTEHLKNPQLSRMHDFFNTYYVPNNMTMTLVGNVNPVKAKELVQNAFGKLERKNLPPKKEYNVPTIDGPTFIKKKLTPIRMGILLYRGVPANHKDVVVLDFMTGILSNNAATGFFDELSVNGDLLGVMSFPLSLKEHGLLGVMYMPKLIGQSFDKAEKLVHIAIEKVKNGEFDDSLFEGLKQEEIVTFYKAKESMSSISNSLANCIMSGITWKDHLNSINIIKNITKEDVVNIANKYFNNNYISYRSGMGFPKKDKIEKPDWKPLEAKNSESVSDFAKMIYEKKVDKTKPQKIEFGKDVIVNNSISYFPMYIAKNPYNDIFNLNISFNYGSNDNKDIGSAISHITLLGTKDKSFKEIRTELQNLGASIDISGNIFRTMVIIEGLESNIDKIFDICSNYLNNLNADKSKLERLSDGHKTNLKFMKKDAKSWADAVYEFVLYGGKSSYINTPTKSEIKDYTSEYLIDVFKKAISHSGAITVTSNLSPEVLSEKLTKSGLIDTKKSYIKSDLNFTKENNITENTIFYINNKKFRQSNIYFHINGISMNEKDKAISKCFNKYFGADMYSIVFQEIREFRSLGYTSYGIYSFNSYNDYPGYMKCFLGTQSDKTVEGVEIMTNLVSDMPVLPEKFNSAKEALLNSLASSYIDFRNIPSKALSWNQSGYKEDPRPNEYKVIEQTSLDDIFDFYKRAVKNKAIAICMSGNFKTINLNDLKKIKNFKVVEYKFKNIVKE